MKSKITYIVVLIISCVFGGIASAEEATKKPMSEAAIIEDKLEYSGFLGDYKDFKVVNPETKAALWIKPPHQDLSLLKDYHSIVFSPIEIWMDPNTSYRGIDPNELKLITDYFLENLQKELGSDYKIVEESGPGVMNIRIAITGLGKEKPDYKKVYNLIPVKLVWEAGNAGYRKVAGKQIDVYQATAEIEIRDSEKSQRLVAAVDRHAIKGTTEKGEDTWAPLQKVLDFWVKTIKNRLAKARSS